MYKQISHEIQGQDTPHNLNNIFTIYSLLPNYEVFAVFFKTFAVFLSFFRLFASYYALASVINIRTDVLLVIAAAWLRLG